MKRRFEKKSEKDSVFKNEGTTCFENNNWKKFPEGINLNLYELFFSLLSLGSLFGDKVWSFSEFSKILFDQEISPHKKKNEYQNKLTGARPNRQTFLILLIYLKPVPLKIFLSDDSPSK